MAIPKKYQVTVFRTVNEMTICYQCGKKDCYFWCQEEPYGYFCSAKCYGEFLKEEEGKDA